MQRWGMKRKRVEIEPPWVAASRGWSFRALNLSFHIAQIHHRADLQTGSPLLGRARYRWLQLFNEILPRDAHVRQPRNDNHRHGSTINLIQVTSNTITNIDPLPVGNNAPAAWFPLCPWKNNGTALKNQAAVQCEQRLRTATSPVL